MAYLMPECKNELIFIYRHDRTARRVPSLTKYSRALDLEFLAGPVSLLAVVVAEGSLNPSRIG